MTKPAQLPASLPSGDLQPHEPHAPRPGPRSGPHWDRQKMADFLRMLAATHSVSRAAASVGMSRQSAYKLRSRLKGEPFDIAW